MSTVGLCGYCEKPAQRTCRMCGQSICREHTDHGQVCTSCAEGTMGEAASS